MAVITDDLAPSPGRHFSLATAIRRNPTIAFGGVLLALLIVMAACAPLIAPHDPFKLSPVNRLRPPSERWWFGTDQFGRDVFSRTIYGARVSLIVGLSVALISSALGLALGIACGYFKRIDGIVMRVMDGLMAIPSILLAIALITLARPGLGIVIVAIVIIVAVAAGVVRGAVVVVVLVVVAALVIAPPTGTIVIAARVIARIRQRGRREAGRQANQEHEHEWCEFGHHDPPGCRPRLKPPDV